MKPSKMSAEQRRELAKTMVALVVARVKIRGADVVPGPVLEEMMEKQAEGMLEALEELGYEIVLRH